MTAQLKPRVLRVYEASKHSRINKLICKLLPFVVQSTHYYCCSNICFQVFDPLLDVQRVDSVEEAKDNQPPRTVK